MENTFVTRTAALAASHAALASRRFPWRGAIPRRGGGTNSPVNVADLMHDVVAALRDRELTHDAAFSLLVLFQSSYVYITIVLARMVGIDGRALARDGSLRPVPR